MNLIFWQNKISPHQYPYIYKLSEFDKVTKVILVVPEILSRDREKLGWSINYKENDKFSVILNPDKQTINDIFNKYTNNSHHFFSGLSAFPFVFYAFKISLNYKVQRSIITETPFFYKKPPFLHLIKHFLFDAKYYQHIHSIYAIGSSACNWYSKLYKGLIINFKYCTENTLPTFYSPRNSTLKLVFVGSFIKRKNIEIVIKALSKLKEKSIEFHLIGDGPLRAKLIKMTQKSALSQNVFFHGVKNNSEIPTLLSQFDVLILPSHYDGWGAVVNEALQSGLYVLVSNNCGSKDLIDSEKERGIIFNPKNSKELLKAITHVVNNINIIRSQRINRIQWANENISPKAVATYFLNTLV